MEINTQAIVFLVGMILTVLSFIREYQNRSAGNIYLLMAGAFLLQLSVCLDPFLHEWDERYHALVAKNLQHSLLKPVLYPEAPLGYDYTYWASNYVWLHKQPLALWLISCSLKFFGVNEFSVRIPSLLLSTIAVWMTFQVGSWLFSQKVGIWAAFLQAINGLILETAAGRAATDHVDLIFSGLIEIGIFLSVFSWKTGHLSPTKRTALAALIGIVTGLAILCKWLPALIIILLYTFLHRNRSHILVDITVALLAALFISAPWQIYAAVNYPKEYWYEMNYNSRHFYETLEGHGYSILYYIEQARINWNELVYLPVVWLVYRLIRYKDRPDNLVFIAVWIFIPYLVFSIARTQMAAYVMFTAPAVFMLSSCFLLNIAGKWNYVLKNVVIWGFVLLGVRYSFERAKPFIPFDKERADKQLIENIDQFSRLKSHNKKTIIFNAPGQYIEIMFYTDHIAYPYVPSIEQIKGLLNKNYSIVILDNNLPTDFQEMPNVSIYSVTPQGIFEPHSSHRTHSSENK